MKQSAAIDVDDELITVILTGRVRLAQLQELKNSLSNHSDIRPDHALLVDLRLAELAELTSDELRAFAALPMRLVASARRAFVAPGDLSFGLARMYEILRAGQSRNMQVFRDIDEARRWLVSPRDAQSE